ncbi:MAG: phage holin family protein [Clostridia bacterium]|nr:phage holin family protein [Clostridia bacterium]
MSQWVKHLVRLVVSALVLMFISFLIPGFATVTFWTALIAAAVITVLGWLIETILGRAVSPYGRGIVGFLVSAVVIYATKFIVPGMTVSIPGALLAAFVIGLVDMFVPTTLR